MTKEVVEESKEQGWPLRTGSVYTEYEARINDNGTMSISVTYYQYTGGAHGYSYKKTVNLDLVNEKELLLKELFDSSKDYKQVLTDKLLKQMFNDQDNLFPETLKDFKASDDMKFYLTDKVLFFILIPMKLPHMPAALSNIKFPMTLCRMF